MPAHGGHDLLFDPGVLEIEMGADLMGRQEFERVDRVRPARQETSRGVGEHEPGADVELDEIGTRGDAAAKRSERVFRARSTAARAPDHGGDHERTQPVARAARPRRFIAED